MATIGLSKVNKNLLIAGVCALSLFAVANVYAISQGFWWFALLPIGLAMVAFALLKPIQFWLFLVLLTPYTMNVQIAVISSTVSLPTEPFIAMFMVLLVFKFLLENKIDYAVLRHPITIIILLQLFWLLVSSSFSSMPIVSFKYFISRTWFVVVFYFFGIQVFKDINKIDKFNWYYVLSMGFVIIYTLFQHSAEFFSHDFSYKASRPFFTDHNIYAVVVAFFIPTTLIYALKARSLKVGVFKVIGFYFFTAVFIIGVVASYTRAAWVSLGIAFIMYVAVLLRLRLRHLLSTLGLLIMVLAFSWNDIMLYMSKNKVASDNNLDAHIQSIYNVTTDDSNTERLNRWSAAVRMFLERPIFGYGPNTYQFQYAPFQLSREKTKISTNLGDLGNSHSEFVGPLAEQGLFGGILVILLMLFAMKTAMNLFYKTQNNRVKYLALMVLLSFVTYYTHGLLNNYLDIDKANIMFWASMAMLTALTVYHDRDNVPAITHKQ